MHIDEVKLQAYIKDTYQIDFGKPKNTAVTISSTFKLKRVNNGAIIIQNENKNNDPLDLPSDQLKRIVRGIIWRDEHFDGLPLKKIATRGGHGENYVNRCIQESFTFLSA